jgi:hypothetical protein
VPTFPASSLSLLPIDPWLAQEALTTAQQKMHLQISKNKGLELIDIDP